MKKKEDLQVDVNNLHIRDSSSHLLKVYIETYGCQMNVNDSEVVASILAGEGYRVTQDIADADLILINTCSVRENAEQRVRGRLDVFRLEKKKRPELLIGVIGCMAERLKHQLLEEEKSVDLVVGPDAYRDLPNLVRSAGTGLKAINVLLSREETYSDISPVRMDKNRVSSFVSIMRGCNNRCAFCIVPYTRGIERSRSQDTILREVRELVELGYKEVTLLGQNVDSYRWGETGKNISFAQLLTSVAAVSPDLRVRFSTSHPKDMTDEVLHVMASHHNICKSIHLPAQSGSTRILELMRRRYTREWYLDRIEAIKRIMPECSISTDIIAGFCTETEADHQDTLSLMKQVHFDYAFMFKYSVRPNTLAAKKMDDDVPEDIKSRRLQEIINLQGELSAESKQCCIGKTYEVLSESISKKSPDQLSGRNTQNMVVVFPKGNYHPGDYVQVRITGCTPATLLGELIS
ncbi:MAG: tRNA (N6-isopentenyl adenosine(37)-C2)-methylthiotransferase MiaB [Bacteroidales bacterium]|jgi:tRNA-2-methylthio-N6-dimethylallyladenosine synthase|nr:tRNA (N6-isopentenyl adenosine(37)-C2)-methylthiotransferase MiaB [Bacteroidales bacterium]